MVLNKSAQKLLVGCAGLFLVGFLVAGLQVSRTSAQTAACSVGTNDWCAKWSVANWLNDKAAAMTVGPADWAVSGQIKKDDGTTTNYIENWQLSKLTQVASTSEIGPNSSQSNIALCRSGTDFNKCAGGGLGANTLASVSPTVDTNFNTQITQGWRWRQSGLYGLVFWGLNGEPSSTDLKAYFPSEWQVTGKFQ